MKKISIFFTIYCILPNIVFSQDTITVYYNKNWEEIPNKNEAVFYRKAFIDSNHIWHANDYYINNKIQMSGQYKTKKLTINHGHFTYYYENGQKESEGKYIKNMREGEWCYWYENGQKKSMGNYINNKLKGEWSYWNIDGHIFLKGKYKKGIKEGEWVRYFPESEMKIYYKNGFIKGEQFGGIVRNK